MTSFYWSGKNGGGKMELLSFVNEVGREQAVCFGENVTAADHEAALHDGSLVHYAMVEGRWTWLVVKLVKT